MYGNKHDKQLHDSNNQAGIDSFASWLTEQFEHLKTQIQQRTQGHQRKTVMTYVGASAALLWVASGIYIVDEGNQGVVTRFGAYQATTSPGPHWHLPFPIEKATVVNVAKQRYIEVGYSTVGGKASGSILNESLMLTEDENIIDVKLAVQYQINNARDYLFNVEHQEASLKQATQSAERAIIGKNRMDFALTEGRSEIVTQIQKQIQNIMDDYRAGIVITSVNLQDAQPPEQVQAAFEEAIKAREDKQRLINEAEAYANEIVPKARGGAARKVQEAQAYKENVIATATGDISRFNQLYTEYKKSPQVTRKRLLIEAMETVLDDSQVVMLDSQQSNNMLYLPLDKMLGNTANTDGNAQATQTTTNAKIDKLDAKFKRAERGRD